VGTQAIKKALPAVTSSTDAGKGLNWVQQMVNACNGGCHFDYINIVSDHSSFQLCYI
jgi:3-deoxy-D-manno-octulosonic acid (KDO) 8-phosphate synthase